MKGEKTAKKFISQLRRISRTAALGCTETTAAIPAFSSLRERLSDRFLNVFKKSNHALRRSQTDLRSVQNFAFPKTF